MIAQSPPLLIVNAARDNVVQPVGSRQFVKVVTSKGAKAQLVEHPNGLHAFDLLNDDDTSRAIIKQTLEFLKSHLTP